LGRQEDWAKRVAIFKVGGRLEREVVKFGCGRWRAVFQNFSRDRR
jgi:hypothetical protein